MVVLQLNRSRNEKSSPSLYPSSPRPYKRARNVQKRTRKRKERCSVQRARTILGMVIPLSSMPILVKVLLHHEKINVELFFFLKLNKNMQKRCCQFAPWLWRLFKIHCCIDLPVFRTNEFISDSIEWYTLIILNQRHTTQRLKYFRLLPTIRKH